MRYERTSAEKTADLSDDLAAWREHRRVGMPIPEEFWVRAVQLAQEQGVYKIARALPLDYGALKKRVGVAEAEALARPHRPAAVNAGTDTLFVELFGPASNCVAECRMRIISAKGSTLEVDMRNVDARALGAILKEFGE